MVVKEEEEEADDIKGRGEEDEEDEKSEDEDEDRQEDRGGRRRTREDRRGPRRTEDDCGERRRTMTISERRRTDARESWEWGARMRVRRSLIGELHVAIMKRSRSALDGLRPLRPPARMQLLTVFRSARRCLVSLSERARDFDCGSRFKGCLLEERPVRAMRARSLEEPFGNKAQFRTLSGH